MISLDHIIRAYDTHYRRNLQSQLEHFCALPTLEAAIECAALAVDERGKRYSHQRRVRRQSLDLARRALQSMTDRIQGCQDFDDLYALIESLRSSISGIGPVYVYDTALRIGAKLRLLPERVYLHAGTLVGARNLGLCTKARSIEVADLPLELRRLKPWEIEDILCIYKTKLAPARRQHARETA